jgi:DNA helicase-2/ATP-dependent DNA helicase PcrA
MMPALRYGSGRSSLAKVHWAFASTTADKQEFFENNRNLFYVACSRPKVRLALLFTQILNANAMAKLNEWFGAENVVALPADPPLPAAQ